MALEYNQAGGLSAEQDSPYLPTAVLLPWKLIWLTRLSVSPFRIRVFGIDVNLSMLTQDHADAMVRIPIASVNVV